MDYDDYSYDDYSYDEQSYGYDDQYDDLSYHDYGEENNDDNYNGYDNTDLSVDHEVTEVFPSQDDEWYLLQRLHYKT